MKKIIVVLMIAVLSLAGCKKEPTTIRIGVNDWPPCEVWYIAKEQDLFKDVKVEIVRFSTWTDNMNALYLGNIDITHSTYFNNILFSNKGEWGQMIAPIDTIEGGDGLVIASHVDGITDLIGRKIAVEVSTDEHYLLYQALEMNGVDISDVEIVSASSAKTTELFLSGEVDGIFTYEPYLSMATEGDVGSIVFTTKDLSGHMVDVLVGRKELMDQDIEPFVRVLQGYYDARAYIELSGDYQIMAQNEAMSEEAFEAFYGGFTLYDAKQALETLTSDTYKEIHDQMTTFVLDNKLVKEVRSYEEIVRTDVLLEVVNGEK